MSNNEESKVKVLDKNEALSRFKRNQVFNLNAVLLRVHKVTKKDIILRPLTVDHLKKMQAEKERGGASVH